jgi:hypothetical protein
VTHLWRHRLTVAAPVAIVALLAVHTPGDDGPTLCPFAQLTGIACPGCGMTRAASYLIHGDLATALHYHPLVPLIAALMLAGWGWYLLRRSGRVPPLPTKLVNAVLVGTGVMLLGVWAARLATGTLPPV